MLTYGPITAWGLLKGAGVIQALSLVQPLPAADYLPLPSLLSIVDIFETAVYTDGTGCPTGFSSVNEGGRAVQCLKVKVRWPHPRLPEDQTCMFKVASIRTSRQHTADPAALARLSGAPAALHSCPTHAPPCPPALQPGMDTAAAFLETRRYAGIKGATTEFSKWVDGCGGTGGVLAGPGGQGRGRSLLSLEYLTPTHMTSANSLTALLHPMLTALLPAVLQVGGHHVRPQAQHALHVYEQHPLRCVSVQRCRDSLAPAQRLCASSLQPTLVSFACTKPHQTCQVASLRSSISATPPHMALAGMEDNKKKGASSTT